MICSKCGHEINGVVKFCPKCGNPMAEAAPVAQETPAVEETPVVEEAPVADETPAVEETPEVQETVDSEATTNFEEAQPAQDEQSYGEAVTEQLSPEQQYDYQQQPYYSAIPQEAPKAKKKLGVKGIIIIVVAVIAVAAAVGAIFYFNKAAFTSGKKLLKDSIVNAVDDTFADSAAFYDQNKDAKKDGTVTATLTLDEGLKDMLEDTGADLDWLDSAHFTANVSGDDEDLISMDMVGGINGVDIASLVYVMDLAKEMGYMQIPELSDEYVSFNFEDLDGADVSGLMNYYKDLNSAEQEMLSSDDMRKLAVKYTELALDEIDDVEKDKDEIEADGVEASCYALSTTIDERTVYAMTVAVGNEMLEDKDLKEAMRIMYDYQQTFEDAYGYNSYSSWDVYDDFDEADEGEDFDEWYEDEFIPNVKDLVEKAEKELKKLEKHDDTGEEYGELNVYVDKKGELRGIDFETNGTDNKVYAYYPEDGDEFGYEIGYESSYTSGSFVGSGTNESGVINGEFKLVSDDRELLSVEVIDYDSDQYKKGKLVGEFVLTPGEDAYFGYDTFSTMLATMSYDFKFDATGDDTKCSITLKSGDTAFATLDLAVSLKDVDAHKVPSSAYDGTDDNEMEDYVETMSFDKLISNLKEAGVPSEYTDYLEEMAEYMY